MNRFTTINDIPMIELGDYNWRIRIEESDNTEVFELQMGILGEDILTALYGKNTLSIRQFDTTFNGGFILFMEIPLEYVPMIITSILKAHKLSLLPIYHRTTVLKQPNNTQDHYEQGSQSHPIDEFTEELLDHKKSSCPHCNTLFDGILCDNCGYFEDVEDVEDYYKHRK